MFIRRLILQETHPKKKIIRDIPFKLDINLIVDDSKHSGNNVGKTTVLKIIDICLGQKDKSSIYTDQETNLINQPLKNYIHTNKIEAILELSKSIDNLNNVNQKADYYISVGLFSHGKRKINNVEKNIDDEYLPTLKEIIFDYVEPYPRYTDLIKKFVRVEIDAGSYKLLRFSPNKVLSNLTYRLIYNFLFNLIETEDNIKLANTRINSKKFDEEIANFNKFLEKKDIKNLEQTIFNQSIFIKKLTKQIKENVSDDNFLLKMEKSKKLKSEIGLITQSLGSLEFQINMIQQNLEYTFQSKKDLSPEVLQTLYNETRELKVDLEKTFNDLVIFNDSLVKNKVKYYESVLKTKSNEYKEINEYKKSLKKEYKSLASSIEEYDFDNADELYNNLVQEQAKLLELQSLQLELKNLNTSKESNLNDIADLETTLNFNPKEADDNLDIFNKYFQKNTKDVLKNEYHLGYNTSINDFPLSLFATDESISIGTKKGLISVFDISYLQYAKETNKQVPYFIVYDVIETIENDILTRLFNLVKTMNCQYIVAVLNEKIKDIDVISENDKILTLSKENKLFMI
ncbi:hypothetical protein [Lysinibacillus sphaericus]|uniref:hypothetical protein n=1 Tax=Lysinibacillus sphaericus TaxID=1421 RepID=UPI003D7F7740